MSFPVACTGGLLGLTLSGLDIGPNGHLMTVCGSVGGVSVDVRTGRIHKTIPQVAESDQVWCESGVQPLLLCRTPTAGTRVAAGAAAASAGAVGVVNAATEEFVEDIRIEGAGVHSVAVNASNHHIFVPVSGKGIFVIAPAR